MEPERNTIEYINNLAKNDPKALVEVSETRYQNVVNSVAQKIVSKEGREIIMLAGPSASGKTTTAHKIAKAVQEKGNNCYVLSLDDFYLNRSDVPGAKEGKPDYETVYALDLPLIHETITALLQGKEVKMPCFDFTIGKRVYRGNTLQLDAQDSILVEGLHALNPIITDGLPQNNLLKIYISVSSRIYNAEKKIILNKRNLRFMRRLVRDYLFRASSVENTLQLWESVRKGEDLYLFPYADRADLRINSIHYEEPCLFAPLVHSLISHATIPAEYQKEANRLLSSLRQFEPIDEDLLPDDSLLREFVGEDGLKKANLQSKY